MTPNYARTDLNKGLCILYLGNGKGKSTAAFGLAARCIGHGGKVCVCQFLKSNMKTGEVQFFSRFPDDIEWYVLGRGFVTDTLTQKEREKHCQAARDGIQLLAEKLTARRFQLVVADELLDAVELGFVTPHDILHLQQHIPESTHLVMTGRTACAESIALADTVTEMNEVKHHYHAGIQAVRGVEY